MDWVSTLYSWIGYDFWGMVLSLASAIFAWLAYLKSRKAAEAAEGARRAMTIDDALANMTIVQQHLVEVRLRCEAEQWDQASERCESIRSILAPILQLKLVPLSEDVRGQLIKTQGQVASLQRTFDQIRHNSDLADVPKISSVISKQVEAVSVAVTETRVNREGTNNV